MEDDFDPWLNPHNLHRLDQHKAIVQTHGTDSAEAETSRADLEVLGFTRSQIIEREAGE